MPITLPADNPYSGHSKSGCSRTLLQVQESVCKQTLQDSEATCRLHTSQEDLIHCYQATSILDTGPVINQHSWFSGNPPLPNNMHSAHIIGPAPGHKTTSILNTLEVIKQPAGIWDPISLNPESAPESVAPSTGPNCWNFPLCVQGLFWGRLALFWKWQADDHSRQRSVIYSVWPNFHWKKRVTPAGCIISC